MCKEMPVIPVNRVVDPKRIIGMEGREGGEAQGVADPPPKKKCLLHLTPPDSQPPIGLPEDSFIPKITILVYF
jgi:hypothetical protein